MQRLAFGILLGLCAKSAVAEEAFREIAVKVEHKRDGAQSQCRVVAVSEANPEAAQEACNAVERVSTSDLQTSVVRIWQPPATTGIVIKPTDRRPRGNYLATDDGIERFNGRTPTWVAVVYLINAEGAVEQCMSRISTTPPKLAGAVCDTLTKRFRFNPATRDGAPISYPREQGFLVPARAR